MIVNLKRESFLTSLTFFTSSNTYESGTLWRGPRDPRRARARAPPGGARSRSARRGAGGREGRRSPHRARCRSRSARRPSCVPRAWERPLSSRLFATARLRRLTPVRTGRRRRQGGMSTIASSTRPVPIPRREALDPRSRGPGLHASQDRLHRRADPVRPRQVRERPDRRLDALSGDRVQRRSSRAAPPTPCTSSASSRSRPAWSWRSRPASAGCSWRAGSPASS